MMKNILYICPTREIALSMERRFERLDNVRFGNPGAQFAGEGYDLIIMFDWFPVERQDRRWFEEVVMPRCMANTQLIYASDIRP